MPTYARVDLAFERGEGAWLIATNGERYLDFTSGVAVNALGHAHPHLVAAIDRAGAESSRTSPTSIVSRKRSGWPARLCAASFADFVFFCNSGAEAMECAIKMARKYQSANGKPERYRIITFEGAFHGRTLATLAAGGQKKYLEGFGPVVEGFDQVPFGDLEATKRAIGPATAAILIEPIMGEGGVRVVAPEFLRALRELCDQHGLLLIFDEVQTGMGRTGELFAYQRTGVAPDIMALAKALGGGFPVGACLATAEAAKGMTAGTHGSTFGGNPLAMAAGNAVLDVMLGRRFPRARAAQRASAQAAARRDQGSVSLGDCRGARRRTAGRPARGRAERRAGRRAARREDDHRRGGRQCGAALAAADRERGGDRRGGSAHRARLRSIGARTCRSARSRERPDERQRRPPLPRSHRRSAASLRGMIDASRAMKERVKRDGRSTEGRSPARRWR